ncbi:MAG: AlpA family phage regulatory protein [Nitrosospira sp.]|jgi:prophage regulatory protein|nr:AlpA family phage regulatory protein [Nitrosospira sp.]MBI0408446.1 AlpA family phage regulatory protein [Nitrosospira sp.]
MFQTVSAEQKIRFDELPDSAFIRLKTLIAAGVVPFSASTVWRKVRCKEFPSPITISDQITAWRVRDVRQWQLSPGSYSEKYRSTAQSAAENIHVVDRGFK